MPLERLRRWEIDFPRLAAATASALQPVGELETITPSRLWLLGRIAVGGEAHELFLARGLCWPDAADVIGRAPRLLQSPRRIVLAPGRVPGPGLWQGEAPRVLPLSALLSGDGSRLVADNSLLTVGMTKKRKPAPHQTVLFPTPAGATWEDVCLTFSEQVVCIEVKGVRRTLTFQEAGFEERRRHNAPNRLWTLLRAFALHGGVLPFDSPSMARSTRVNLKQYVTELGQQLALLMQIAGRPFKDSRRTRRYETRFRIATSDGVRFPTPAGIGWEGVSITEPEAGLIAVSADAVEPFVAYSRPSAEGSGGRWDGAVGVACLSREYDLPTLGLADSAGHPSAAGQALLAVLRGAGKIRREPTDRAMLALCKRLTELLQLDGSPFEFSPRNKWSARFTAASAFSGGRS